MHDFDDIYVLVYVSYIYKVNKKIIFRFHFFTAYLSLLIMYKEKKCLLIKEKFKRFYPY